MAIGKAFHLDAPAAERPGYLRAAMSTNGFAQPPLRVDVTFPILGFLMDSAMTGYDLKRRFQDPVGFFYRISDGSLYPALKRLARKGLVTMRTEKHGRRMRKVYAITPSGRDRFLKMLAEPSPPVFVHDEAQVKIYFAHHAPYSALAHMERMRQMDEASSKLLSQLVTDMRKHGDSPFRRVVVEIGRQLTEFKAEMMERMQTALRNEIAGLANPPKRPAKALGHGPKSRRT